MTGEQVGPQRPFPSDRRATPFMFKTSAKHQLIREDSIWLIISTSSGLRTMRGVITTSNSERVSDSVSYLNSAPAREYRQGMEFDEIGCSLLRNQSSEHDRLTVISADSRFCTSVLMMGDRITSPVAEKPTGIPVASGQLRSFDLHVKKDKAILVGSC